MNYYKSLLPVAAQLRTEHGPAGLRGMFITRGWYRPGKYNPEDYVIVQTASGPRVKPDRQRRYGYYVNIVWSAKYEWGANTYKFALPSDTAEARQALTDAIGSVWLLES
jgi:hypothetical protein